MYSFFLLPTEVTMTLVSSVSSQPNLVQLDAHNVLVDAGQSSTIPDNSGDH